MGKTLGQMAYEAYAEVEYDHPLRPLDPWPPSDVDGWQSAAGAVVKELRQRNRLCSYVAWNTRAYREAGPQRFEVGQRVTDAERNEWKGVIEGFSVRWEHLPGHCVIYEPDDLEPLPNNPPAEPEMPIERGRDPAWETALTVERLVEALREVIASERGSIGDHNMLRQIIEALESDEK